MAYLTKRRKPYLDTANSCTPRKGKETNFQVTEVSMASWKSVCMIQLMFSTCLGTEMDNRFSKFHLKICSLFHCSVITGYEPLSQCGKWTCELAYEQKCFPKESWQNCRAWFNARKRAGTERSADDRWYFILLRVLQLFAVAGAGGGGGTGQIPVVVYQETTSLCHVEVLTPRGFHLAPSDAHRNTSTGSATLGNQWLYALPSCRYCSVDLWRDGEAKTD